MPHAFVLQSYTDHRDLHSFPTRRSSDLGNTCVLVEDEVVRRSCAGDHFFQILNEADVFLVLAGRRKIDVALHVRSEEHTSELQSLRHLVCRLLLEKKKNTAYTGTHTTGR